jgi:pimeloyl-ACP methyl ester carboxylesterase
MAHIVENVAGVQLSVRVAGGGTPTLIFVHGGFCTQHDWSAQVRALEPRYSVVTFDMPGHGDSTVPHQASVAALAEALRGIISKWGGGRAVLVGHSLGVDVSLEAYRQSSAGIAGLVLIEGGLVADGDPERAVATFQDGLKAVGLDTFLNTAFGEMFTPRSDPQLRQQVLDRLKTLDRHFAQDIILSKIHWDASEAARVLARVTVPVLLLQSTYFDETFRRRSLEPGMTTPWTELVMRQVPSAELHCVPGVGHFPQIEAADVVNQHIAAFAERLRAG